MFLFQIVAKLTGKAGAFEQFGAAQRATFDRRKRMPMNDSEHRGRRQFKTSGDFSNTNSIVMQRMNAFRKVIHFDIEITK